ncbi:protelomerase family protein [Mesorhizobium denitrificans]|uniref:Telomere resolvase ResT/TelK catalytic domain-containing protein n=1 Tax=Mesorhizobium denitrificans TaxID=2294114 RepID=A0A371X5V0_9HYPH|nr:protelomerase family protein [Mesorhizobium denitrificans]MCC0018404.1 hypothetical protein [Rhodobiaceae bacterium]RFC64602.1 hypothetical protein DY251_19175 [Mesorhizobium denitrificans]
MSNEAATESATAPKRMGRPSVVADAIPLFVEAVRAVEEGYEELWRKEWDERIAGKAISTRAAYVSKYRTAIKDALGSLHPSLLHIKILDRTESEEQRRTYTSRSNAGRPGTRREAIETFVRHAKLLNDARHSAVKSGGKTERQADAIYKRAISKLWDAEIGEWRGNIEPSTILSTTTRYRNALREASIADDLTLSLITAPEDVQKAVTTAYRESVIEQHNELIAVPHWFELVEAAKAALPKTDASWSTLQQEAQKVAEAATRADLVRYGAALGLLTGRRPYEIFCQGSVAPAPLVLEGVAGRGYESWRVIFSGQAKTRGRDGTQFDQPFPISTLTHAKDIVFAWTVLRLSAEGQVWRKMTNQEFASDLLRVPNPNAIYPAIREELFGQFWPKPSLNDSKNAMEGKRLTANNVRSLYAEIADNFFRPKSKSKAAFIADVLGHTEKDIETASAYMKYYLPDQKSAGPGKRVKGRLSHKIAEQLDAKGLPHERPDHEIAEEA